MLEYRYCELRSDVDGRRVSGTAINYHDAAKVRHFTEKFSPGGVQGPGRRRFAPFST